jgi:hypothetical protein
LKHGNRADHEFGRQACDHYFVVPFSANVDGLPIHVDNMMIGAYECRGPLVSLAAFHDSEFFVCPPDLSWSMVYTHEDHSMGGPYFIRTEWLPGS